MTTTPTCLNLLLYQWSNILYQKHLKCCYIYKPCILMQWIPKTLRIAPVWQTKSESKWTSQQPLLGMCWRSLDFHIQSATSQNRGSASNRYCSPGCSLWNAEQGAWFPAKGEDWQNQTAEHFCIKFYPATIPRKNLYCMGSMVVFTISNLHCHYLLRVKWMLNWTKNTHNAYRFSAKIITLSKMVGS